jgi:hypothetical protein
VDAHTVPQHFHEAKRKSGLAPASFISTQSTEASVLKPVNINRSTRPTYPVIGTYFILLVFHGTDIELLLGLVLVYSNKKANQYVLIECYSGM